MFERLRERLDRFLAERTPPADRRERREALYAALVEAKAGLALMREQLAEAERALAAERQQLADAERRGTLAGGIGDHETADIAKRFVEKHGERVALLERKVAVQRDELALAEREYEGMRSDLGQRESPVGHGPVPEPDLDDAVLRHELDRARRESAAEAQLEQLKRKVRGEG